MRITLFTTDDSRHNFFINLLSEISSQLCVVQESNLIGQSKETKNQISIQKKKYFKEVSKAQKFLFGDAIIKKNNIQILKIPKGKINDYSLNDIKSFLSSDFFIVFGSSYIKGDLVDFLISKKTVNIHMGLSPFYRGSDCNFWAVFDNNPHLVGATIHLLSKGLDSGPILYHAITKLISKKNVFEYTMSSVKSAFYSIKEKLTDKTLFEIKPEFQDKSKEIRYSKSENFTDEVIKNFFEKKIDINSKSIDLKILKRPYIFEF